MLTNTGAAAGAEVAQLYIGFPVSSGEPPQVLRAFTKVPLAPGASQPVTFPVAVADVSVWSVAAGAWRAVQGSFGVFVGTSSRDIRLTGTLEVSVT